MNRAILVFLVAAALGAGCQNPRKKQMEKIDADAEVMARVSGVVNEVIRNAPDCETAKPLLAEAYQRIGEARGRLQVGANLQTLEMMKLQVDRVAQACP